MTDTPFVPIGDYAAPSPPAERVIRRWIKQLREKFHKDDPAVAAERLRRASNGVRDGLAEAPACGPLIDDLQLTLARWLEDDASRGSVKVIVLPPCERSDLVGAWARKHGHRVIDPPVRSVPSAMPESDFLAGEGLIVIPRLERWFLRHRTGLDTVRKLVALLDRVDSRCVIGCNSWAWGFLAKATGAAVVLPKAVAPTPFDDERLGAWFRELASENATEAVTFRLANTGDVVLARDAEDSDARFMQELAARSLGIPWVAWHLWRDAMRTERQGEDPKNNTGEGASAKKDARTIWITDIPEFKLPDGCEDDALLVLQALLIHGDLNIRELEATLPAAGHHDLMPSLVASGFVDRDDDRFRVRPAAYPSTRKALQAAGYPMDVL